MTTNINQHMQVALDEIINRYKAGSRESLLPLLQDIQIEYGYLNEEAILKVGKHIKLPSSKVYGIATFYDQFRFVQKGKFHIKVCRGTSCHMHGSLSLLKEVERVLHLKEGQTTRDGRFSLEAVSCMGACGSAPVLNVNGDFKTTVTIPDIAQIIDFYRNTI
ncbi:MAG: NAD(P)H-dependent oxidoreductase subunit E [Bacteroidota bacterium]